MNWGLYALLMARYNPPGYLSTAHLHASEISPGVSDTILGWQPLERAKAHVHARMQSLQQCITAGHDIEVQIKKVSSQTLNPFQFRVPTGRHSQ